MKLRLPLLAASCSLVAGCALAPPYTRPDVAVPATFPLSVAGTVQQPEPSPAALPDWRGVYTDPSLQRLIETALQHNADLRVAVANIERARAQLRIADADRLPSVNAAVTGSRQQPNASGGTNAPAVASAWTAGITVPSWELDFFGRVGSLGDAARAQYLATEEARRAVQVTLIADVANAYLNLLAQHELLGVADETANARRESLRLVQLKFDNGTASELDLAQARSLHETARGTLALQMRLAMQATHALQLLVGRPLSGDVTGGARTLSEKGLLAQVAPGLPSDLLTRRPDIRQAEQSLIAANANIGAARAALFPRIQLTASTGVASRQLSELISDGVSAWSLAPQLVLPLLDWGRTRAGVEAARASREIAVAQYQKAVQSAFREVADALAGEATYGAQLSAVQAQAEAEALRLKLVQLRFDAGTAAYLDLLDAQRSLFSARQALVQTRLGQQQNRVALYRALGGGWDRDAGAASGPQSPAPAPSAPR